MVGVEQLKESCARAGSWLSDRAAIDMRSPALDLGDVLRMLLGCWLCESAVRSTTTPAALSALANHVESRLYDETQAKTFDPFHHDTKLLLLACNLLSMYGRRAHGIEEFAQQIAQAFKQLPLIPLRYIGEVLLLAKLGYCEHPQVSTLGAQEAGTNALSLLRADEDQVRSVCHNIAAATHFGRQSLQAAPVVRRYLDRILPIVLLGSLREYNLELSSILIRAIHFLRPSDDQTLDVAINFLMDQQLADGRFGHFDLLEVTHVIWLIGYTCRLQFCACGHSRKCAESIYFHSNCLKPRTSCSRDGFERTRCT